MRLMFVLILLMCSAGAQNPPVPSDIPSRYTPEAITEIKAKAEAGNSQAQVVLGQAYEEGNGVPQNEVTAAKWYRKAAEQGNAEGQNNLGIMYRMGSGVEQDKAEAVRWYLKAAKQGYANAYFNLGTAYYNADGVPADPERACAWFELADEAGSDTAKQATQRSQHDLPPDELGECYAIVGDLLSDGQQLPAKLPSAVVFYKRAADHGSTRAGWTLASFYTRGIGVEQDPNAAAMWRQRVLNHATPQLMVEYGNMLRTGTDVPQNLHEALVWYAKGAEQGYAPAMLNLGIMYAEGMGTPRSDSEAYVWVAGAALRGSGSVDITARRALGMLESRMTPEDVKKARREAKKRFPRIQFPDEQKKK